MRKFAYYTTILTAIRVCRSEAVAAVLLLFIAIPALYYTLKIVTPKDY